MDASMEVDAPVVDYTARVVTSVQYPEVVPLDEARLFGGDGLPHLDVLKRHLICEGAFGLFCGSFTAVPLWDHACSAPVFAAPSPVSPLRVRGRRAG